MNMHESHMNIGDFYALYYFNGLNPGNPEEVTRRINNLRFVF